MKLPTATEYVIDIMGMLAKAEGKGLVKLRELSEGTCVSRKYLENLMMRLSRAGFVDSFRGRDGGYRLAKKASKIKVLDIIRHFEGSFFPDRDESCKAARRVNAILRQTFERSMRDWTLAKLV